MRVWRNTAYTPRNIQPTVPYRGGSSTSTSLRPPSTTDDTATLVRMPILNLIFKPNNKVLYKINVQAKTN
jgi:hypothetical protein